MIPLQQLFSPSKYNRSVLQGAQQFTTYLIYFVYVIDFLSGEVIFISVLFKLLVVVVL